MSSSKHVISTISPDPKVSYPIVLGKSFFQREDGHRPTGFVSATYRFKPSSVDQSKLGNIAFENTKATLQFARRSNANNNNNNANNQRKVIQFRGESKLASDREFFLWFDANSQKMVLERCGIQIKQLKHDREQRVISVNYSDTSMDRMKQMTEKHKKKKIKKQKKDKKEMEKDKKILSKLRGSGHGCNKKSKIIIQSSTHNQNLNKYESSSTRSTSRSISPQSSLSPNTTTYNNQLCDPPAPPAPKMPNISVKRTNVAQKRKSEVSVNHNGPQPLFGFDGSWDDSDSDDE